jgi:cytochrome c-type biogenesis protein CcmH/NrfG
MLKRLLLLILVIALAWLHGSFIIKNLIATSLVAYGETATSRDLAVAYAPHHPAVRAARGKYLLYRADPPRPTEGIAELERAANALPFDYRYWLELGRAYETNSQPAQAEQALSRALALAPRYFETRWALANFYLRSGRTDEALRAFRQALEFSGEVANQTDARAALNAYEAIAQALGMNLNALRQVAPPDVRAQAYLAKYLAEHQALDPALETWRALAVNLSADVQSCRPAIFALLAATQAAGRFADARAVWQGFLRAEGRAAALADNNLLNNAGFEQTPVFEDFPDLTDGFDWRLRPHPEVQARRDDLFAHSGRYALRLSFPLRVKEEFQHVSQLVAAGPQQIYRLRYFVKTNKMFDPAPYFEITDAQQPGLFAIRLALPTGTNDWREQTLVFTTPADTHGLRLTFRAPQTLAANNAEVWLDDFRLESGNVTP